MFTRDMSESEKHSHFFVSSHETNIKTITSYKFVVFFILRIKKVKCV